MKNNKCVNYILNIQMRDCCKDDFITFIKHLCDNNMIVKIIQYDYNTYKFGAIIQLYKNGGILKLLSVLDDKYDVCHLELEEEIDG